MREPIAVASSEEAQIHELNRLLQAGVPALVAADGERLELPETVYHLLKRVVRDMEHGKAITLIPEAKQLTTQRAAHLLGVSRPHLIKLLTGGEIPYHTVGSHRRIYLRDVIEYARRRDAHRHTALNALARDAFEAGLYDHSSIPEGGTDE